MSARRFPRVHSLVYLLDLCERIEPGFAALREGAASLSPYAIEVRYRATLLPSRRRRLVRPRRQPRRSGAMCLPCSRPTSRVLY